MSQTPLPALPAASYDLENKEMRMVVWRYRKREKKCQRLGFVLLWLVWGGFGISRESAIALWRA